MVYRILTEPRGSVPGWVTDLTLIESPVPGRYLLTRLYLPSIANSKVVGFVEFLYVCDRT
jgi:hypothetical protein